MTYRERRKYRIRRYAYEIAAESISAIMALLFGFASGAMLAVWWVSGNGGF